MGIINFLIVVGFVIVLVMFYFQYKWWRRDVDDENEDPVAKDEDKNKDKESIADSTAPMPLHTKEFLKETLRNIGCRFEEGEEGSVMFEYQGAYFTVSAKDKSPFILIVFFHWYEFSSYDIDKFSAMQKSVNEANRGYNASVFYEVDKERDMVYIHSLRHFIFIPEIPYIESYLRSMLREFFYSRQFVCNALDKLDDDDE